MLACALGCAAIGRPLSAQVTLGTEQNPPEIAWRVVDGIRVRVIAPAELVADARRLATLIDVLGAADTATLGGAPRRVSVVLQGRSATANGFVTLMPRRSEWFFTAPQGDGLLGANDWLDLLAIHEYRHVKQFDHLDRGVTRFFSRWFGEPAQAAFLGWTTPSWLLEGDAVATETALTQSGRGRLPSFDAELRGVLLDRDVPSYWTTVHRSFGTFIPDQYQYGFHVVRDVRAAQGARVWADAMAAGTRRAFLPWTLSASLARQTGRGLTGWHQSTLSALQASVRRDAAAAPLTAVTAVGTSPREWTDDDFPQWDGDTSVVVLQSGLDVLPTLVRLTPSATRREVLQSPGPIPGAVPHSVGGHAVYWIEQRFDPRWGYRSYSVVMRRDLRSGFTTQLGDTTRWVAVAAAPTAPRLVVIEQRLDRAMDLVELDTAGTVQSRLSAPPGDALVTPRYAVDGRSLFVVRVRRGAGRRIERCRFPLADASCEPLTAFTSEALHAPTGNDTLLLATLPVNGRDEVVARRIGDAQWWQVTRRPVGATTPVLSPLGDAIAFNDQTGRGRRAVLMLLDPSTWTPLTVPTAPPASLATLVSQEAAGDLLARADSLSAAKPMRDAPYRPSRQLFNPYGWSVLLPPLGPSASVRLLSQDVLGTLGSSVGVGYDLNESAPSADVQVSWGGGYWLVDADARVSVRRDEYPTVRLSTGDTLRGDTWRWRETSAGLGIRLPLRLTQDLYSTFVTLQASVRETRVSNSTLPSVFQSDEGSVRPVTLALSAGRGYGWLRDIQPVWGQYLTLVVRETPLGGTFRGRQWMGRTRFFAPGVMRHHGLEVDVAGELQARRQTLTQRAPYRFSSLLPFARGYPSVSAAVASRVAVDYVFPLWYPDLTVWQTLQVRRLRGAFFADDYRAVRRQFVGSTPATAQPFDTVVPFRSVGAELWADTRWWYVPVDIPLGLRYAWRLDPSAAGARGGQLEFVASFAF